MIRIVASPSASFSSTQSPTTFPAANPPAYPMTCSGLSRYWIALPAAKSQIITSKNPMMGTSTL